MSDAHEKSDPRDFSKLDIRNDGRIYFRVYQQDGRMVEMSVPNTLSNRIFVSLLQITDRYVTGPEWEARDPKIGTLV